LENNPFRDRSALIDAAKTERDGDSGEQLT
jgi:hypothetical protein